MSWSCVIELGIELAMGNRSAGKQYGFYQEYLRVLPQLLVGDTV